MAHYKVTQIEMTNNRKKHNTNNVQVNSQWISKQQVVLLPQKATASNEQGFQQGRLDEIDVYHLKQKPSGSTPSYQILWKD